MSATAYYVGLDVGGTSMKASVVDETGKAARSVSLPTEAYKGQEYGLARMAEVIRRAIAAAGRQPRDIAGIGVATPGTMDIPAGIILDPPNLRPWQNVPVRQYIHETFGVPTAFQNDANAAALGEFWVGAGREVGSLVMFTLGTGIGGGIILFDRVLEGKHSHGAEIGHMKIEMTNPRQCGCGRWGCLEAYASATAVVKRAREALAADKVDSRLKEVVSQADAELTARAVFEAAAAGDALAAKLVDETAYYLAVGAMNMMHVIDPEMVAFGGGMIAAGETFLNRIRGHVRQLGFPVLAEHTQIRYAQLGSDAGSIGAAACARLLVNGKL
jgi:glucokinase